MSIAHHLWIKLSLAMVACLFFSWTYQASDYPESDREFAVMAYYTGNPYPLDEEVVGRLTHIIYSFLHLQGNKLALDDAQDSVSVAYLVSLKKTHPDLKVMLSLGGWGGCETCSEAFSTRQGRKEFATSVKALLTRFHADGIDLDWEYPSIEGYPGHTFVPEDRENFTSLVSELRKTLGDRYIISFAAGGFNKFLKASVDWKQVMPVVDLVNLMSYDLVNGNSTVTGHHTPLYSTASQVESTDNAIRFLDSLGIPMDKVVIGAAFYARVWENVANHHNGLYQAGKFKQGVSYNKLQDFLDNNPGFTYYWDSTAQAPYWYNADQQLFATYDDSLSIARKTEYAIQHKLGGIMFWELGGDQPEHSLLKVINKVKRENGQ